MADRGGWIQPGVQGMRRYRQLGRTPLPYFSVKFKHLGHVGKPFADYYGDEITWGQLGSLRIPWGNSTVIKYSALQPGWTYWWEIGTWDFTVTDDVGNVIVEKVRTLSDLGITWEIFESHQFSIHISGKFENEAFLIAWRYRRGTGGPGDPGGPGDWFEPSIQIHMMPYLWGEFEKYLLEYIHIEHRRLTPADHAEAADVQYIDADMTGLIRSLVFAHVVTLSATGNFPAELLQKDINTVVERVLDDRKAESYLIGNLLMIQVFASIDNMSKPVFEPWMLWHLWQWMGKSGVVVSRERVFDLSPWWG
jgi:hypothetical protein